MKTERDSVGVEDVVSALDGARTQNGLSLADLSASGPVILVFLRHAGCTFCRETLADLAECRQALEQRGIQISLVHQGDDGPLERLLIQAGMAGVARIADPARVLYRAFGLRRGRPGQLLGPKVLWRALAEGALARHGIGPVSADAWQMPGVFYLENSTIVQRFRHRTAADRPDYAEICTPTAGVAA